MTLPGRLVHVKSYCQSLCCADNAICSGQSKLRRSFRMDFGVVLYDAATACHVTTSHPLPQVDDLADHVDKGGAHHVLAKWCWAILKAKVGSSYIK